MIWLSLWQARRSGTHYRLNFVICLAVLVTLDAAWRRYFLRDISALSAIEMRCIILGYINFLFYSILWWSNIWRPCFIDRTATEDDSNILWHDALWVHERSSWVLQSAEETQLWQGQPPFSFTYLNKSYTSVTEWVGHLAIVCASLIGFHPHRLKGLQVMSSLAKDLGLCGIFFCTSAAGAALIL